MIMIQMQAVAALKKLENTVPANLTLDYDVEDEENLSVTTETTDANWC